MYPIMNTLLLQQSLLSLVLPLLLPNCQW